MKVVGRGQSEVSELQTHPNVHPTPRRASPPCVSSEVGGKRGGGKPCEGQPSQSQVWNPPFIWYVLHPPSGVVALFFLYKHPRLSTPEALVEGSEKLSGGSAVWYVFRLPSYV